MELEEIHKTSEEAIYNEYMVVFKDYEVLENIKVKIESSKANYEKLIKNYISDTYGYVDFDIIILEKVKTFII